MDKHQCPRYGKSRQLDCGGCLCAVSKRAENKATYRGVKTLGRARLCVRLDMRDELINAVHDALYCSKICAYAQGFQLMRAAQNEYAWKLDLASIASIWRGGCIIRARFLQKITDAYARDPKLVNLFFIDPYFNEQVQKNENRWRTVIALAAQAGIPAPAFMSTLAYYDDTDPPSSRRTCYRRNEIISARILMSGPISRAAQCFIWNGRNRIAQKSKFRVLDRNFSCRYRLRVISDQNSVLGFGVGYRGGLRRYAKRVCLGRKDPGICPSNKSQLRLTVRLRKRIAGGYFRFVRQQE